MSISTAKSFFSSEIRFDLGDLPAIYIDRGCRGTGVLVGLVALFVAISMGSVLMSTPFGGGRSAEWWLIAILVLGGFAVFVVALHLMTLRVTTTIDREHVRRESVSLFGCRSWSEPLHNYRGVLKRSDFQEGRTGDRSSMLYIVELNHEAKPKRVPLYQSKSDEGLRARWEACCQQLGLAGLEEDGGEIRVRPVADVNKSVRELAAEGKVDVAFDPASPPPAGLRVSMDGKTLRIARRTVRISPLAMIPVTVVTALAALLVFLDAGPVCAVLLVAFVVALVMLAACWTFIVTPVLVLGGGQVRCVSVTPWGETAGETVMAEAIVSVRIARPPWSRRDALLIETRAGDLVVGTGLSADALSWLKRCVLAVLTR